MSWINRVFFLYTERRSFSVENIAMALGMRLHVTRRCRVVVPPHYYLYIHVVERVIGVVVMVAGDLHIIRNIHAIILTGNVLTYLREMSI